MAQSSTISSQRERPVLPDLSPLRRVSAGKAVGEVIENQAALIICESTRKVLVTRRASNPMHSHKLMQSVWVGVSNARSNGTKNEPSLAALRRTTRRCADRLYRSD